MTKPTGDVGDGRTLEEHGGGGGALRFRTLYRGSVKQNSVHEFLSFSMDGDHITLVGSTTQLITLEITTKANCRIPFPYIVASVDLANIRSRPLDELAKQVNLLDVYDNCHVLEAQQLTLEPAYVAVCSTEVPKAKLIAAKWAPKTLPNKHMLLASLNNHGVFLLLTKPAECTRWKELNGLDLAVHLRDALQAPFEVDPSAIKSFQQYQSFLDRSWITMMAWGARKDHLSGHTLILATASGHIWVLSLTADAQSLLDHWHMRTELNRICFLQVFRNLLLVGDVNGLVNLYSFTSDSLELTLVKNLWMKPDRMGLQQAVMTHCTNGNYTYITFCKGSHMLTWSNQNNNWLETRLYVGGMKITALCSISDNSYALATAQTNLYKIQVVQKSANHLSLTMKSMKIKNCESYQILGLFSSRHKNLCTAVLYPKKEYLQTTAKLRHKLLIHVGSVHHNNPLIKLAENLKLNEPINSCADLLVEVRLTLFFKKSMQKYLNFSSLENLDFEGMATEEQLQQLQLIYHTLTPIFEMQTNIYQYSCRMGTTKCKMDLLLAMLATTHMRLRLQYLSTLSADSLTPFQRLASQMMFKKFNRLKQQLEGNLNIEDEPNNKITKHFLFRMDIHFDNLRDQLNISKHDTEHKEEKHKQLFHCSISYVEMEPSLDRCYCSLCYRQILIEKKNLEQLYDTESRSILLCPFCHGSYTLDLISC